jgi:hypothetical protein
MPIAQSSASGADETAFDFPSPRKPVTTSLGRNRYMLPQPESAFFVIADISGYTSFLEA